MDYTPEQIEDIRAREQKANETLKELQLVPAAQIKKQNLGNNQFVDLVIPYLADVKFRPEAKDRETTDA